VLVSRASRKPHTYDSLHHCNALGADARRKRRILDIHARVQLVAARQERACDAEVGVRAVRVLERLKGEFVAVAGVPSRASWTMRSIVSCGIASILQMSGWTPRARLIIFEAALSEKGRNLTRPRHGGSLFLKLGFKVTSSFETALFLLLTLFGNSERRLEFGQCCTSIRPCRLLCLCTIAAFREFREFPSFALAVLGVWIRCVHLVVTVNAVSKRSALQTCCGVSELVFSRFRNRQLRLLLPVCKAGPR